MRIEDFNNIFEKSLIRAAKAGDCKKIQDLPGLADINYQDSSGDTALIKASTFGHKDAVTLLLQYKPDLELKNSQGYTALAVAAGCGYEEIVKLLLDAKAEVNTRDGGDSTPLIHAASNVKEQEGAYHSVKHLLAFKADISAKDNFFKRTALMHAIFATNLNFVKALLAEKEQKEINHLECRDKHGRTPLIFAAFVYEQRPAIVLSLLENKADPHAVDLEGNTALSIARKRGHVESAKILEYFFLIINIIENLPVLIPPIIKIIVEYSTEQEMEVEMCRTAKTKERIFMTSLLENFFHPHKIKDSGSSGSSPNPGALLTTA